MRGYGTDQVTLIKELQKLSKLICNFATDGNALQKRQSVTPYAPAKTVLSAHPVCNRGTYASPWLGSLSKLSAQSRLEVFCHGLLEYEDII